MKNPLTISSELLGSTTSTILLIEAATLEFCYDHVNENYQIVRQETLQVSKHEGIQETE